MFFARCAWSERGAGLLASCVPSVRRPALLAVALVWALVCGRAALAQNIDRDLPTAHWAYVAVRDLAAKGLIKGYPADRDFLGDRVLTRYEMATLLQRVIGRMDDLLATPVRSAERATLAQCASEIRDLVAEFKVEMTVIGTDMEKAEDDLASLGASFTEAESALVPPPKPEPTETVEVR